MLQLSYSPVSSSQTRLTSTIPKLNKWSQGQITKDHLTLEGVKNETNQITDFIHLAKPPNAGVFLDTVWRAKQKGCCAWQHQNTFHFRSGGYWRLPTPSTAEVLQLYSTVSTHSDAGDASGFPSVSRLVAFSGSSSSQQAKKSPS